MTDKKRGWVRPAILSMVLVTAGGLGIAAAKSDDWGHGGCARHGGFMHGDYAHGDGFMHRGKGWFSSGSHTEGKLAFLKTELKINADQEQAWNTFANVVRQADKARSDMRESRHERRKEFMEERDLPPLNERIDQHLHSMEEHLAMAKEMATATKTLYGQLTPEQRETADQMLASRHGRHMRF